MSGTNSSSNPVTNSSGQTLVYINSSTQISQKLSKGGNYAAWHAQFTNLLFEYDLIGFIDGTKPCPPKAKTTSSSCGPVENPDHRFWLRQDRLILHAIQSSCTGAVSTLVSRCETSADAWKELQAAYANKSTSWMLSLLKTIAKISKTVSEYMQGIKSSNDVLDVIGRPLGDREIVNDSNNYGSQFFVNYNGSGNRATNMKPTSFGHCYQKKEKIVFILGATATGKSKLSINFATSFPAEIINSDKIQVYKGLDIVTNKMKESDRRGVPHHLLGFIDDPNADFTVHDFCHHVENSISQIKERGRVPIIVGGSNTYIEALVEGNNFRSKYDCCFIWLDVSLPVLFKYVRKRVDQMVEAGLVDEIREIFEPGADYSRGIRRAIGVPELEPYFLAENSLDNKARREAFLRDCIEKTKENTCKLVCSQLRKIHRLKNELNWEIRRIDATAVFEKSGIEAEDAWEKVVLKQAWT